MRHTPFVTLEINRRKFELTHNRQLFRKGEGGSTEAWEEESPARHPCNVAIRRPTWYPAGNGNEM